MSIDTPTYPKQQTMFLYILPADTYTSNERFVYNVCDDCRVLLSTSMPSGSVEGTAFFVNERKPIIDIDRVCFVVLACPMLVAIYAPNACLCSSFFAFALFCFFIFMGWVGVFVFRFIALCQTFGSARKWKNGTSVANHFLCAVAHMIGWLAAAEAAKKKKEDKIKGLRRLFPHLSMMYDMALFVVLFWHSITRTTRIFGNWDWDCYATQRTCSSCVGPKHTHNWCVVRGVGVTTTACPARVCVCD